ncbi:hypothetical protein [Xanthomonas maliensis]|uniref:hypothetical protein n=1 Tax=Xanthomonas maliensis TaxID=1321368 RepID=UPI001479414C|nr:hypothetical protein [Xanthomonas maliensis]
MKIPGAVIVWIERSKKAKYMPAEVCQFSVRVAPAAERSMVLRAKFLSSIAFDSRTRWW